MTGFSVELMPPNGGMSFVTATLSAHGDGDV